MIRKGQMKMMRGRRFDLQATAPQPPPASSPAAAWSGAWSWPYPGRTGFGWTARPSSRTSWSARSCRSCSSSPRQCRWRHPSEGTEWFWCGPWRSWSGRKTNQRRARRYFLTFIILADSSLNEKEEKNEENMRINKKFCVAIKRKVSKLNQ